MCSFCFSFFGTFVFETSCILGVSLVCFVLLGFWDLFLYCFTYVFFLFVSFCDFFVLRLRAF